MYNVYVKTVKVNCPSSWTSPHAVINKLMHLNVYGIMDVNPVTLPGSYRDIMVLCFTPLRQPTVAYLADHNIIKMGKKYPVYYALY